jgi:glycerol-3-phosphate acyltransferase PlsY
MTAMPLWIWPLAALLLGYGLGSIPFGVILTRLFGAGDLRKIGSGNIGATNVLRTGRKGLAAATLILDALKGVVAVLIGARLGHGLDLVAGVAAFYGHLYPVWLKFRGGKGVATMMGLCFVLDWRVGLIYALVWLGTIAVTRISSVGGMAAALSAPIAAFVFCERNLALMMTARALTFFWIHKDNIQLFAKAFYLL